MRLFSSSLCVLLQLVLCAAILALLFPADTSSADGSPSHSRKTGLSSRPSAPLAKRKSQQSLIISPDLDEFSQNPKLLDRILREPHGYFRFINETFAEAVCVRFRDDLGWIPNGNLQGDAHLENYAITEQGRGLTDFDDATMGPVVLDLVRFGVSIHLACRTNGWKEEAGPVVDSFLSGYRAALEDPGLTIPAPELVSRIRARFTADRAHTLAAQETLMKPLGVSRENFTRGIEQFLDQMAEQYPELPPHFFEIKNAGRLKIGIGSALDEKYLFEVQGPTKARKDNVVLEMKEVRDLHQISCILLREASPNRPILMQARLAYQPYRYAGFVIFALRKGDERDKTFWVHEWADHYHELSIRTSFQTPADLHDIAHDAGVQLGLGHPKSIADSYSDHLRGRLLITVAELQERLDRSISDLTQQTIAAWKQFRVEATTRKAGPNRK
ncbi:MAG: DUF2252 family protein [Deltaproteobacteria bacterium]|nr:MAG: DUF2252 family protein [Deltaproteobacteria bacterium]